jgi:hypothetical protein
MNTTETTGSEIIRQTLHTRKRRGHIGWIARDLNVAIADLDAFTAGGKTLKPEVMEGLTKLLFNGHAKFNEQLIDCNRPIRIHRCHCVRGTRRSLSEHRMSNVMVSACRCRRKRRSFQWCAKNLGGFNRWGGQSSWPCSEAGHGNGGTGVPHPRAMGRPNR